MPATWHDFETEEQTIVADAWISVRRLLLITQQASWKLQCLAFIAFFKLFFISVQNELYVIKLVHWTVPWNCKQLQLPAPSFYPITLPNLLSFVPIITTTVLRQRRLFYSRFAIVQHRNSGMESKFRAGKSLFGNKQIQSNLVSCVVV